MDLKFLPYKSMTKDSRRDKTAALNSSFHSFDKHLQRLLYVKKQNKKKQAKPVACFSRTLQILSLPFIRCYIIVLYTIIVFCSIAHFILNSALFILMCGIHLLTID